jgi:UPF0755 protein
MKQLARQIALFVVTAGVVLTAVAWQWLGQPLALQPKDPTALVQVVIKPRSSAKQIASEVVRSGVNTPVWMLYAWFRLSGQSRQIQAGTYELVIGTTPRTLLTKLVTGDQAVSRVTFLEGWTWAQVRSALAQAKDLKHDSDGLTSEAIMQSIGRAGVSAEGRFFPDTYVYAKHSSDFVVLKQAAQALQQQLDKAWSARSPRAVVSTPDDLLTLASMIEKETQHRADRAMVSAVFHNRLRIGMRLQSDPTIIYGLGDAFGGNLTKKHLTTDAPYNSYTRAGLPPTPIAMPSAAALMAAANPAQSDALYFVGKGDGSSHFSANLNDHNAAVRTYILGR